MKFINDEKGIALVTSLMLTLITLVITMLMLYMVLQNTISSGAHKRYKNSLEASVGGVEISTMEVLPELLGAAIETIAQREAGTIAANAFPAKNNASLSYFTDRLAQRINTSVFTNMSMQTEITDECMLDKLTNRAWGACGSANLTADAKTAPDITFTLQSQLNAAPSGFKVYTKILSTTPGSTDLSGRNLEGQATTGQPPGDIGAPYLYRIEVTGERVTNARERANLSVLYAY